MNNWDINGKSSGVVTGVVASEIGTLIMERDRIKAVRDNLQGFYNYLKENREMPAFECAIHEAVIDFYNTEYMKLKAKVSYKAVGIAVDLGQGYINKNGDYVEHKEVLNIRGKKPQWTAEDELMAKEENRIDEILAEMDGEASA